MEITDDVLRKYFEAAVAYRVDAIVGAISALRADAAATPELGVDRADAVINALETARRALEGALPRRG